VLFMEPSLWPDIKRFVSRLERTPVGPKEIEKAMAAPVVDSEFLSQESKPKPTKTPRKKRSA